MKKIALSIAAVALSISSLSALTISAGAMKLKDFDRGLVVSVGNELRNSDDLVAWRTAFNINFGKFNYNNDNKKYYYGDMTLGAGLDYKFSDKCGAYIMPELGAGKLDGNGFWKFAGKIGTYYNVTKSIELGAAFEAGKLKFVSSDLTNQTFNNIEGYFNYKF